MHIGILGVGKLGSALGQRWAASGHDICFGVRDPHGYTIDIAMNAIDEDHARIDTMANAAAFGDVVALALPWLTVAEVLEQTNHLEGKIVIDCTNPTTQHIAGGAASGAEEIARLAPHAHVVKAFNTLGAENLYDLRFGAQNAATFICGDDFDSKAVVNGLGQDLGFEVIDVGPLSTAALIESLAQLWLQIARREGREVAFAILRRHARIQV